MNAPVSTTNIAIKTAVSDELIVNRDGSTSVQATSDLALQLASSWPLQISGNAGKLFTTYASLAATAYGEFTPWVFADPDINKNGLYRWNGASWVWSLPLPFSFLIASNFGAGTAAAIKATTLSPVSTAALILLPIADDYAGVAATVSFNGGQALAIKSSIGEDVTRLAAGSVVYGVISGNTFRLANDEAIASLIYEARDDAEDAADRSEAARAGSEAARDIAAGYASDAISGGMEPGLSTIVGMGAITIPVGINAVRINGLHSAGDGGGGLYIRADEEPTHGRKWQDASGAWFEDVSKPIFIAATGQSNFEILRAKDWTPARNLRIWDNTIADIDDVGSAFVEPNPTLIGAPLAFANAIALANPGQAVFLVVVADGGQPISQWLPGASAPDIYAALKANVEPALMAANVPEIDTMLWWQGETGGGSQSYVGDFETVQSRFKSEGWFRDETPLVVFGVSPSNIGGGSARKQINMTLQMCCGKAPSSRMYVNTGQFSDPSYWVDQNHMTADGYEKVGRMAAYQFLGRSAGNSPGLSVDFETGNVGIGMTFTQAGFARNRNAYGNPTPAVTSLFHGVEVDNVYPEMRLHGYGSAAGIGGLFTGCASGGTGAAPTSVKSGALLAALQGAGRTVDGVGGATGIGATIRLVASEDWAPTARGSQIEFMVPENGTGNAVLAGSVRHNRDWVFERNIIFKPQAAAVPSINGQMSFELASDTSLIIRVRGSDGVVRSANLALS
ncbi:sialate O-acetylesterase [Agrobacterium sp.]|uniref:sialate O-acetylesterase n=1 Tax=Agrobacterium sp. TaxID=361 RepID=UPI0025BC5FED|nr:sialate O-acetylesterase [Agrobacterium sp.]MCD4663122.1 sialate O-acetylesterase [Agrobacterium sp.]